MFCQDGGKMKGRGILLPSVLDAPCKGCDERYAGCHSKCQKYLDFRNALNDYNKEERKKIDAEYMTAEVRRKISRYDRTKRGTTAK